VSDAVKELGGAKAGVQKSLLARHLSERENATGFSMRVSTAKTYGLIEGHGSYSLTSAAQSYYFPTTETSKKSTLLQFFETPTTFKELLRRFDGDHLPSRQIIGNILHKDFGIGESWKDRVAGMFLASAQFVGAVDAQGFLRFKAAQHSAGSDESDNEQPLPPPPPKEAPASKISPPTLKPGINTWTFSLNGKSVHIQTPEVLDAQLWQKLNGYVQLLNPGPSSPQKSVADQPGNKVEGIDLPE
jgi:hypothetical protein